MSDCVFCDILSSEEPAVVVGSSPACLAIEPIHPVCDGHVLIIPRTHVESVKGNPILAASTMMAAVTLAADLGYDEYNVITSAGPSATQTVPHLHLHLIPRRADDGMRLPWGKLADEHKPKSRRPEGWLPGPVLEPAG